MANNKKCIVCGTEYSYCPSCKNDRKKPVWMNRFDKEECKEIFETGCAFEEGLIDTSEASKKLQGKNLTNIVSVSLRETLAKIGFLNKEKEVKAEKKEEKVIVEKKVEEQPEKKEDNKEEKKAKKFFE